MKLIEKMRKEVELVIKTNMEMLDVKIQDSKKQYKGVIFYEKYFLKF